jgi:nitrogen regulatory protein P-II 1
MNWSMKRIEAVIRRSQLNEVTEALSGAGITGMTVSETRGFGRTGGRSDAHPGAAYAVHFIPKVTLEIVLPDGLVEQILAVIQKSAVTGRIGDGKIFVSDVIDVVRIRTGERGEQAV